MKSSKKIKKGQLEALNSTDITTGLGYTPENEINKQDSLTVDGTGTKYPTVDTVNTNLALKEDKSNKGISNGYASLDGGGKVPISQLPNSVMEYKGAYDASTNTPTLVDGTGNTGDTYRTSIAGAGVNGLNFVVGDYVVYNGTTWEKVHSGADNVTSVFGRLGTVVAQNGDYTASQITNVPSGNISSITVQAALNELDSEKAIDSNVLHTTGNESFTGIKSSTNTGATQINGISLTNNGTSGSKSLNIINSSTGTGIDSTNNGLGVGIKSMNTTTGVGIRSDNTSTGFGIYSSNSLTGQGIRSDNTSTGQGIRSVNSTTGQGIYSDNSGTGQGIYSNNSVAGTGIHSLNLGIGFGIYSQNEANGVGIVSNGSTSSTGFVFAGRNNNTNTFTVDKSGNVTANSFIKTGATSNDILLGDGTTVNKFSLSESRVAVNDANYTIVGTNNFIIAYTAITADRTVTLPPATTANQRIWITDESGLCSNARRIIVAPNGADVIGGDSFSVINFPNGSGYLESNGAGKWNIISTTSVQFSSGVNTAPTVTDNGNGSITVGTGVYSVYANTDGIGRPKAYQVAGGTFTLTDNNSNFIYADYNTTTGIVSLQHTTTESPLNDLTQVLIYAAYRQGTTLHPRNFDRWGVALTNKLNRSIYRTQRVRFEEGSVLLGESASPAVRTITISGGTVWIAAAEQTLTALTSAANTCYHVIQTAPGVWNTTTIVTQYNNVNYNTTTGLQTLTNNRYAVNWVYRSVGLDNDMAIVLGDGDYTLGQAQTSAKPTNTPPFLRHMELIGRIIVEKNANTATQIDMVSSSIFTQAGVTDHNALNNLQLAQAGVTYGHVNDQAQTIAGDKTFTGILQSNLHWVNGAADGTTTSINFFNGGSGLGALGSSIAVNGGLASNIGLDVQGVNDFEITTNNSKRLVVKGNGNIGIGTTAFVGVEKVNISFNSSTSFNQALNIRDNNSSASSSIFQVFRKSDDTYLGNIRRNLTDNAIFIGGNDYLSLGNGDIERMRIASNGNVGIGTTTPQSKLSVATTGNSVGLSVGDSGSATGKTLDFGYFLTGDYGYIQAIHQLTGMKNLAINPNGGNVGIGTTTPSDKLTVKGVVTVKTDSFVTNGLIGSYNFSPEGYSTNVAGIKSNFEGVNWYNGSNLSFYTRESGDITASSDLERMRIAANGNVTINTLAGTGTRVVTADASGVLSTTADVRPYKVYTALVTQSGTSAPTEIILENTLGTTITFARTTNGVYTATAGTAVFTNSKTTFNAISRVNNNDGTPTIINFESATTTVINFRTSDIDNVGTTYNDDCLNSSFFEIKVYN